MKMNKRHLVFFLLLPVILSCEKAFMEENVENTPLSIFEVLWKTLDERYAYFSLKSIDWDSLHDAYKPMIHDPMTLEELWEILSCMLCELQDGHMNLVDGKNWSSWWQCKNHQRYPDNFDFNLLRKYFFDNLKKEGPLFYGITDSVGYIYYQSFTEDISDKNMDNVISFFEDLKGIIIDVRSNGG